MRNIFEHAFMEELIYAVYSYWPFNISIVRGQVYITDLYVPPLIVEKLDHNNFYPRRALNIVVVFKNLAIWHLNSSKRSNSSIYFKIHSFVHCETVKHFTQTFTTVAHGRKMMIIKNTRICKMLKKLKKKIKYNFISLFTLI